MIYSADWVLPIAGPPIANGAVAVNGSTIAAVGSRAEISSRFPGAQPTDFGEAVILPGLINAHSHLELTAMRGFLEADENDFFAWLRKLTVARRAMSSDDLRCSAIFGALEAARAGITCVADASSAGIEVMMALREAGLRGIVYQESFGPDPKLAQENFAHLVKQLSDLKTLETDLLTVGLSPHAPYTVSAPQLELIARLAFDEKLPLMMHAAESQDEELFLMKGSGIFADGLRKRGIEWQPPRLSTIKYLERCGILKTRPLLAHCINVDDADLQLIKDNGAGIAHCPKSNAKLGHGYAPFAQFRARGIHTGLGTDSVASNNTCDILEEARFATLLARANAPFDETPEAVSPRTVTADQALFAATLGGARALHLDHSIGSLAEGMQADITVVALSGAHQQPLRSPADALVFSSSGRDVLMTMVAGKEIYRDGQVKSTDEQRLKSMISEMGHTLDSSVAEN